MFVLFYSVFWMKSKRKRKEGGERCFSSVSYHQLHILVPMMTFWLMRANVLWI